MSVGELNGYKFSDVRCMKTEQTRYCCSPAFGLDGFACVRLIALLALLFHEFALSGEYDFYPCGSSSVL